MHFSLRLGLSLVCETGHKTLFKSNSIANSKHCNYTIAKSYNGRHTSSASLPQVNDGFQTVLVLFQMRQVDEGIRL